MGFLKLLKNRHSVRKFQEKKIEKDVLEQILLAGQLAPSGHNEQFNHFVVIQNKDCLLETQKKINECFCAMETPDKTDSFYVPITKSKSNSYPCMYNPAAFIIISNKRSSGNAMADVCLAMENMMLMATELQIGSCWVNQIRWLQDNPTKIDYLKTLGIPDDEVVCASLSLGYFDNVINKTISITGNKVDYID